MNYDSNATNDIEHYLSDLCIVAFVSYMSNFSIDNVGFTRNFIIELVDFFLLI